jgi:hypothetical protein
MPCHPHQITKPSVALSSTASVLLRKVPRGGAVVGRGAGCGIAADNLLTTRGARSHRHSSTLQRGSCGPKRSTAASPATSTHDAPWRLLRAPARRSSGLDDRWSAAGPPTLVGSGFRSEASIGHKCRWGGGARGGGPLVPLLQDPPRLRRLPGRSQARQPEVGVPDAGNGWTATPTRPATSSSPPGWRRHKPPVEAVSAQGNPWQCQCSRNPPTRCLRRPRMLGGGGRVAIDR